MGRDGQIMHSGYSNDLTVSFQRDESTSDTMGRSDRQYSITLEVAQSVSEL